MDYEFTYQVPQAVNQESLDLDLAAALPAGVYRGSLCRWNDQGLCVSLVVTVSRELTTEELNAISGN